MMTVKEIKIQLALGSLSYRMKYILARHYNTPKEILTILSKDKNKCVKYWVATNPNTPEKVLKILSKCKPRYCDSIRLEARRTLKRKLTMRE